MSGTNAKAKRLIRLLAPDINVSVIKSELVTDDSEWNRVSRKAYQLNLQQARKQREQDEKQPNLLCTSNKEINAILAVNDALSKYALCIPSTVTMPDIRKVERLLPGMPSNEHDMFTLFEKIVLSPHFRAQQKKGRFERLEVFKEFVHLIDAATLCYCRGNYISSYMTLVPVIEGIILRWIGYNGHGKKPDFKEIGKFFSHAHARQPCPCNPLFHDVFTKACDKILEEHLYKNSKHGGAYSNFNRHLAVHLFSDTPFATKENCIRLFLLIDVMSEIYIEEKYIEDPRFKLTDDDTDTEETIYYNLYIESAKDDTPEKLLLGNIKYKSAKSNAVEQ